MGKIQKERCCPYMMWKAIWVKNTSEPNFTLLPFPSSAILLSCLLSVVVLYGNSSLQCKAVAGGVALFLERWDVGTVSLRVPSASLLNHSSHLHLIVPASPHARICSLMHVWFHAHPGIISMLLFLDASVTHFNEGWVIFPILTF